MDPVARGDPVARVLGKDLTILVHRFVHQLMTQELNKEYFSRLYEIRRDNIIVFKEPNTARCSFMFNYRHPGQGNPICKWGKYSFVTSLPRNYWGYAKLAK